MFSFVSECMKQCKLQRLTLRVNVAIETPLFFNFALFFCSFSAGLLIAGSHRFTSVTTILDDVCAFVFLHNIEYFSLIIFNRTSNH